MTDTKFYQLYKVRSREPQEAISGLLAEALDVDVELVHYDRAVRVEAGLTDHYLEVEMPAWAKE